MFCPQCGAQIEQPTRYCKACGCRLDPIAPPFAPPREAVPGPSNPVEAERQLRWLRGTRSLLMGAAFLPFALFAVVMSGAARGGDAEGFAFLAFMLLLGSLCTSGWGIINLLRGG